MEENLKFLITQTEERIKMVDTKASILLAFYGLLISSRDFFNDLFNQYDLNRLYLHALILLLCISALFLILTLKPPTKFSNFFKWTRQKEDPQDFWLSTIAEADQFDYSKIKNPNKALEKFFISISKRRIIKYKYFRIAVWLLRISILLVLPLVVYILFID